MFDLHNFAMSNLTFLRIGTIYIIT